MDKDKEIEELRGEAARLTAQMEQIGQEKDQHLQHSRLHEFYHPLPHVDYE